MESPTQKQPAGKLAEPLKPPSPSSLKDAQALEASLFSHWDARLVDYDEDRYPFRAWIEERVRALGHPIRSLETLHETVDTSRVYVLTKELCAATRSPEFVEIVRRFVTEVVAVKGGLHAPLAIQRFLNVRIMLPARPQGVFPFHTGLLYGHGPASRSLWLPLTDVRSKDRSSASLQIVGLKQSRELIEAASSSALGIQAMAETFGDASEPVSAGPGDVLFFTQENLHGNFVNETGCTRVSIDFRVAEAQYGDRLARKIPGGYFELLEDTESQPAAGPGEAIEDGVSRLIYLHNNTPATVHVPVHLQRLMVLEHCRERGLDYHFEYFELEGMDHLPTLMHAVDQLGCHILLYSVYALPEDAAFRARILDQALANGLTLTFVNEDLSLRTEADRERIERLLAFAGYGRP